MVLNRFVQLTLVTGLLSFFGAWAHSEVVGSYSEVNNTPAWLTFKPNSVIYKGLVDRTTENDDDNVERRTPSRILKSFFEPDGRLRKDLIRQKILGIKQRMKADFAYDCREDKDCDETSGTEFKKWTDKGAGLATQVAISRLERFADSGLVLSYESSDEILNSPRVRKAAQDLFEGLEIAESVRSDDRWLGRGPFRPLIELKDPIRIQLPREKTITLEATNLINSAGTIAGPGVAATSQMDPMDSGFWRKPKAVSQFSTFSYNGLTKSFVGADVIDPDKSIDVSFSTAKGGGATPKIRVDYKSGDIKLKFKLKYKVDVAEVKDQNSIGAMYAALLRSRSEVRVETALNNIAAAMGYTVEPTYYKRRVRLFLPSDKFDPNASADVNLKQFNNAHQRLFKAINERALGQPFGSDVVNRESAFQDVRQVSESGESKGRYYLLMENVQIEPREDGKTEIDVGFFVKHTYGREFKREFRGFQLFYAWISDTDTGDRNADLKIIKTKNDWKVVYSPSDMGAALGFLGSKDTPNLFQNSMIRKVESKAITLNYLTEARNPLLDTLTLSDALWFLKYATQLTPTQFQNAFLGAGYNACVADVLANKMMSRRQSLVEATGFAFSKPQYFDLQSCTQLGIEIGKNWEIVKVPAVPLTPPKTAADDRPLYSDDAIGVRRGRPLDLAKGVLSWAAASAVNGMNQMLQRTQILPGLFVDGGRTESVAGVGVLSILPARYIIANPLPNRTSPWLVVDIYSVGVGPNYWLRQKLPMLNHERSVINVQGYSVRERIMVRPVDEAYRKLTFKELRSIYARPDRFIRLAFDKIDSEDLGALLPGEILITSTYTGVSGGTSLSPQGFFSLGGGIASISGGADLIQRQAVYKESPAQLLAAWIRGDRRFLRVGAGLSSFIPLLGEISSFGAKKEVTRTQLFRFQTPQDLALLQEEIRNETPSRAIPQDRQVHESKVDSSSRSLLLSAFGLSSIRSSKQKTLTELTVGNQTLRQVDLERSRRKNGIFSGAFKNSEVVTQGTLRGEQNLFVRMDITYRNIWARKKDIATFKKLVEIFPENGLIRYDDQWNEWLGSVAVDGVLIFTDTAVQKILAQRPYDELCEMIHKEMRRFGGKTLERSALGAMTSQQFCSFAVDKKNTDTISAAQGALSRLPQDFDGNGIETLSAAILATRQFLWNMPSAQARLARFNEAKSQPDSKKMTSAGTEVLEKLTQLLHDNALPQVIMRLVDQLIDKNDHYRFVSVRSSTEGIPGQNAVISSGQGDEEHLRTMMSQDLAATAESAIHRVLGSIPLFDGVRNMRLDRGYNSGEQEFQQ